MRKRFVILRSKRVFAITGLVLLAGLGAAASLVDLPEPLISPLFKSQPAPEKVATTVTPVKPPVAIEPENVEVLPKSPWVDSILNNLSVDEKIGQLFMVSAYSNRRESEYKALENMIREYGLGGVIFFQGGPGRQAVLTNRYQSVAKVPLLIGLDAEWGLGMRLDSTISYPRQLTLGAIKDNRLIEEMGAEIGRQLRRIGVHVNFAPVADINTNPRNPVIGTRSFGDSKTNVAEKASAYMRGLQSQRVIAVAKHFPGHGDTEKDSHRTLPVVNHTRDRLLETELFPFRRLIRDSILAVMSGHLYVPSLGGKEQLPTSLSKTIIEDVLRKEMGFKGLVFTDAMNMRGVLNSGKPAEVNLKAILAGNDIILSAENVVESINGVKAALADGTLTEEVLDQKVRRILQAKYFAGLDQIQPVELKNLRADVNSSRATALKRELSEAAVALIRNKGDVLPLENKQSVVTISLGTDKGSPFQSMLTRIGGARHLNYTGNVKDNGDLKSIIKGVQAAEKVVVALHKLSTDSARDYGLPMDAIQVVDTLSKLGKKTVLCLFGAPYVIEKLPSFDAVVVAYQNEATAQETAAQVLYGALAPEGMLSVSAGSFQRGTHLNLKVSNQLAYSEPDQTGVNGDILSTIDYLANEGIMKKAYPGCQVLIAHKGRIIFEKAYGTLSYDSSEKVTAETIYDLASVTKVASTVQAMMLLYDQKKISLDAKVSQYLPELKGTDKQNITIRELLVHRSGLKSFYPKLWESTMLSPTQLSGKYYHNKPDSLYSLRVAPTLYAINTVKDSVWKWIIESPMGKPNSAKTYPYVYSDLGFLTLQKVIEKVSGEPLDVFVKKNIYEPLGLNNLVYNPLEHFGAERIAPTEDDSRFRGELLRGTVHDQMAALYGGVAGHAGLFGNARDLAVLLQMNLWKGTYAGKRLIRPETIELFTKSQPGSSRGLGWDKPRGNSSASFLSEVASSSSYGHTGFTGNIVWVDPEKELIYIFLSNRVNPSASNSRLNTLKTRKRVHDAAYEAILRSEPL